MSDEEDDYYDDDDYIWLDEGPVTEADDLAAHAIQSPVYDPALEFGEDYTDWEGYYSDEYYDCIPASKQATASNVVKDTSGSAVKRKAAGQPPNGRKRRKIASTEDIPELSLGESLDSETSKPRPTNRVVIWKTADTFTPHRLPIIGHNDGEKVGLLKDWRQRFKDHSFRFGVELEDLPIPARKKSIPASAGVSGVLVNSKNDNATKSRKRKAELHEETESEPKKRTLISRPTVTAARNAASKNSAVVNRNRRIERPPEPEDEADLAPAKASTMNDDTTAHRSAAPLSRNIKSTRNSATRDMASRENSASIASATAVEAGTGTRRSKRSKWV